MSTKMTVACAWKDPEQNLDVTIAADLGATTKVWTGYRGRLHTIEHNLTTLNSLTPRDCATLSINVVQCFMTEGARNARDRTKY